MQPNFQPDAINWDEHTSPCRGIRSQPRYTIHAEILTHYGAATSQLPQNMFISPRIGYQPDYLSR